MPPFCETHHRHYERICHGSNTWRLECPDCRAEAEADHTVAFLDSRKDTTGIVEIQLTYEELYEVVSTMESHGARKPPYDKLVDILKKTAAPEKCL